MAISYLLFLAICQTIFPYNSLIASTPTLQLGQETDRNNLNVSGSRRKLASCSDNTNPIDKCSGLCPNDWTNNRTKLAGCAVGQGAKAAGGKDGPYYVVTSNLDLDAVNPTNGTLRHAVLHDGPLWIVFQSNMIITLKEELIMTSLKTIDGRGFNVQLTGCSGITIQNVNNVIINGITISNMKPCGNAEVRSSSTHTGLRAMSDGDAISIFGSKDVWINHCTLSHCADGLVDVVMGSTGVTVSNCHFSDHNEVMLLGHNDNYTADTNMRVTIVYNYFGVNLVQRIPRCRHGYVEVFNNYYPNGWGIYAIGGSACPTIASRGNYFVAPDNANHKEVTYHENEAKSVWQGCSWSSEKDAMFNGAFFTTSGPNNSNPLSMTVGSANDVIALTAHAGALY